MGSKTEVCLLLWVSHMEYISGYSTDNKASHLLFSEVIVT